MKKTKYFFLLVSVSVVFLQLYENSKVRLQIPGSTGENFSILMPRKDRRNLEQLFYAMIREDAGYTLFGAKPMHMFGFYTPLSTCKWSVFLDSISPRNLRIYRGWKSWQNYQHLLKNSEFIFFAEKNPFFEDSYEKNPAVSAFLINKKAADEAIQAHLADFQTVLNRKNLNFEQLILEAKNQSFFNDVLKGHQGLIGILFGYGRENAWLFEERSHGKSVPMQHIWNSEVDEFYQQRPYLAWKYLGICTNELSKVVGYPCFMANPDSLESKQLRQKFMQTREQIIDYYRGKDLLEATLVILTNGISRAS